MRTLGILGDVTDAKDNHPAELVNRTVRELRLIQQKCPSLKEVIALAGNHDWLKAGHAFFRFLNEIPGMRFVTSPEDIGATSDRGNAVTCWMPYSKQPSVDWDGMDFSHYDYLFIHQTVRGAVSSNGQEMDGEALPDLNAGRVFSGDIHVPQDVRVGGARVTYVGSPYHVHFGDDFEPRCVLIGQDRKERDLRFVTTRRMTVRVSTLRELQKLSIREGDQVKLRLELDAGERHAWSRLRREATAILREKGADVQGAELVAVGDAPRLTRMGAKASASPQEALTAWVEREGLGGHVLDAGLDILEES